MTQTKKYGAYYFCAFHGVFFLGRESDDPVEHPPERLYHERGVVLSDGSSVVCQGVWAYSRRLPDAGDGEGAA